MINIALVRIGAERIIFSGLNPKTHKTYVINGITNQFKDKLCKITF